MNRDELETTLTRLHAELAEEDPTVDPALREQLETLLTDIRGVLEGSGEGAAEQQASLLERGREARDRFEVDHPKLTSTLGRVLDMISNMGI